MVKHEKLDHNKMAYDIEDFAMLDNHKIEKIKTIKVALIPSQIALIFL